MKAVRLLVCALLLLPISLCADAQTPSSEVSKQAAQNPGQEYPNFDESLATSLWSKWKHDPSQFTQTEYSQVLDLCIIAYDYLNAGYTNILDAYPTTRERERRAADMDDMGKSSNMVTFVRTFSNRMHHLACEGALDNDNLMKIWQMLDKKEEFKRLVIQIHL